MKYLEIPNVTLKEILSIEKKFIEEDQFSLFSDNNYVLFVDNFSLDFKILEIAKENQKMVNMLEDLFNIIFINEDSNMFSLASAALKIIIFYQKFLEKRVYRRK